MTKARLQAIAILLGIAAVFYAGTYVGASGIGRNTAVADSNVQLIPSSSTTVIGDSSAPKGVDMSQFWTAYNLLNQRFVQTHASSTFPSAQKQLYGAIAGLTDTFGDPYTTFFPPSDAQIFKDDISGSFGGIGMQIDDNAQGKLVVVSPLKGTPSEKAGILSGDLILKIGTTTTDGLSVDDAVKLIRGPKGTDVDLTLLRKGNDQPMVISVTRDTINIPVLNDYKRGDGIFVIELYSFSANSADLFRNAMRDLVQSGYQRVLIDLRGNPGGYLESSVDIASYFLPVGDTVVTEDYKGKQDNIVHRSAGYNIFAGVPNFKMAILVDQGSASASEILAGALSQHGVAKLVGTRTFGKGSVQEMVGIGDGAEMKVTIARWLTPNGTSISDGGLQPDIKVDRTVDDVKAGKDPQKDAAVQYLLEQ